MTQIIAKDLTPSRQYTTLDPEGKTKKFLVLVYMEKDWYSLLALLGSVTEDIICKYNSTMKFARLVMKITLKLHYLFQE